MQQLCSVCNGSLSQDTWPVTAASWVVELRTKPALGKNLAMVKCKVCLACGHIEFFVEDLPEFLKRIEPK